MPGRAGHPRGGPRGGPGGGRPGGGRGDPARYAACAAELDALALSAIRRAVRGLAADGPAARDLPPGRDRLLRRWQRVVTGLPERGFGGDWGHLAEWAAGIIDPRALDYYRESFAALAELLIGSVDPLGMLFPQGRLERAEAVMGGALETRAADRCIAAAVAALTARRVGPLRVLEVGAGTGATTTAVLQALADRELTYLVSDVSPAFVAAARARFGDRPGVRVAAFDLADAAPNGDVPTNAFDVVIAADVLHACPDADAALARIVQRLAGGGYLVASEMTRDHPAVMASLEFLLGPDGGGFTDRRAGTDEVFLDEAGWTERLRAAGARSVAWVGRGLPPLEESGMRVALARFRTDRVAVDPVAVRAHVAARLPAYMVPAQTQVLDALPLTRNGKIDQDGLRALVVAPVTPEHAARVAPNSDLEGRVGALWATAFGVDALPPDAGLFDLGGDSLLAARLAGLLRERLVEARQVHFDDLLRALLEGPTVAQFAVASPGVSRRAARAPRTLLGKLPVTGWGSCAPSADRGRRWWWCSVPSPTASGIPAHPGARGFWPASRRPGRQPPTWPRSARRPCPETGASGCRTRRRRGRPWSASVPPARSRSRSPGAPGPAASRWPG